MIQIQIIIDINIIKQNENLNIHIREGKGLELCLIVLKLLTNKSSSYCLWNNFYLFIVLLGFYLRLNLPVIDISCFIVNVFALNFLNFDYELN